MCAFSVGDRSPEPLIPPLEEREITRLWGSSEVVVTVICAAYQHSEFIKEALDGFLAQKTNFRFEVIVRDDCSTDGTVDIIEEYERRYPGIVKAVYEPFNKFPAVRPGAVLRQMAQGKYVAECDGDDYWIDEEKLQKQVDYLENHKDISLLKTKCVWVEGGRVIKGSVEGGTRTHMYRNHLGISYKYVGYIYFGDTYYQAMLKKHGGSETLEDVTAVWRKHSGGVFGSIVENDTRELNLHRAQTQMWIAQQFHDEGSVSAANTHMANSVRFLMKSMSALDLISVVGILLRRSFRVAFKKVIPKRSSGVSGGSKT